MGNTYSVETPTSKAVTSYFGKDDDLSDIDKGIYYVHAGNYPFAFYLAGVTETDIQPLLNRDNESKAITNFIRNSSIGQPRMEQTIKIGINNNNHLHTMSV